MNDDLLNVLQTGDITYKYEFDTYTATYLAFAVVVLIFVYVLTQALVRRFIK